MADTRAARLLQLYGRTVESIAGGSDPAGEAYIGSFLFPDTKGKEADIRQASARFFEKPVQVPAVDAAEWEWAWDWSPPPQSTHSGLAGANLLAWFAPWDVQPSRQREDRSRPHGVGGERKGGEEEIGDRAGRRWQESLEVGVGQVEDRIDVFLEKAERLLQDLDEEKEAESVIDRAVEGEARDSFVEANEDQLPDSPSGTASQPIPGFGVVVVSLCSLVRSVSTPRLRAGIVAAIGRLSVHVEDSIRVEVSDELSYIVVPLLYLSVLTQYVVPYLSTLLQDSSATVRSHSIAALTATLARVSSLRASDAGIFPQFLLPTISSLPADKEPSVQMAFAHCVPILAETSERFYHLERQHFPDAPSAARDAESTASATGGGPPMPSSASSASSESSKFSLHDLRRRILTMLQRWLENLVTSERNNRLRTSTIYTEAVTLALHGRTDLERSLEDGAASGSASRAGGDSRLKEARWWVPGLGWQTVGQVRAAPLTDVAMVKSILLRNLPRLASFFGRELCETSVLPWISTFFSYAANDFRLHILWLWAVVGVAPFLGQQNVQRILSPFLDDVFHSPKVGFAGYALPRPFPQL